MDDITHFEIDFEPRNKATIRIQIEIRNSVEWNFKIGDQISQISPINRSSYIRDFSDPDKPFVIALLQFEPFTKLWVIKVLERAKSQLLKTTIYGQQGDKLVRMSWENHVSQGWRRGELAVLMAGSSGKSEDAYRGVPIEFSDTDRNEFGHPVRKADTAKIAAPFSRDALTELEFSRSYLTIGSLKGRS